MKSLFDIDIEFMDIILSKEFLQQKIKILPVYFIYCVINVETLLDCLLQYNRPLDCLLQYNRPLDYYNITDHSTVLQ